MKPVSAPPPDGRTRKGRWHQRMEDVRRSPHQWFEFEGIKKSLAQYVKEQHIDRRDGFYCVARKLEGENSRSNYKLKFYVIYSPGKDPFA